MSNTQRVKEATDIVSVIAERIELKRSGSQLKGNCPFHSEKSPSFFVNEQFQRYKCFGCGASGDVFDFIINYERMTFAEALKYLAQQAGITLESTQASPEDLKKEQLLTVLSLAKEYYHFLLTQHAIGEPARQYLATRGITQESITLFQLGYAPAKWDGLLSFLHTKKKYPLDILVEAGLLIKNQQHRHYDRFRDRIMFPLKDHRGAVVGFSGRLLQSDAKEAKYINTPETLLYHKSQLLYGFSELFSFLKKENKAIVVEGEFDVISSAQAHVNAIVAIKGSALTKEHAARLKRVASTILLALDRDSAGIAATKRALEIFQPFELEVRVIMVPDGKDPDECARHAPDVWRNAVKKSIPAVEFLIETALSQADPTSAHGKSTIIKELAPTILALPHSIEQDHYIKLLAKKLEVSVSVVSQDIHKIASSLKVSSSPTSQQSAPPNAVEPSLSALDRAARWALFVLLQLPPRYWNEYSAQLKPLCTHDPYISLALSYLYDAKPTSTLKEESLNWPQDLQTYVFELVSDVAQEYSGEITQDLWSTALHKLSTEKVREDKQRITQELAQLDSIDQKTPEQEQKQHELLKQLVQLKT